MHDRPNITPNLPLKLSYSTPLATGLLVLRDEEYSRVPNNRRVCGGREGAGGGGVGRGLKE